MSFEPVRPRSHDSDCIQLRSIIYLCLYALWLVADACPRRVQRTIDPPDRASPSKTAPGLVPACPSTRIHMRPCCQLIEFHDLLSIRTAKCFV